MKKRYWLLIGITPFLLLFAAILVGYFSTPTDADISALVIQNSPTKTQFVSYLQSEKQVDFFSEHPLIDADKDRQRDVTDTLFRAGFESEDIGTGTSLIDVTFRTRNIRWLASRKLRYYLLYDDQGRFVTSRSESFYLGGI
jgi:hypothetical protein